jgi:hypothetical protein
MWAKGLEAQRGSGGQARRRGMRSSEKEKTDEGENIEENFDRCFAVRRYAGRGLLN